MATKQMWLVKQEPEDYSWDDFVKDGSAAWTGVRNYQARNNLRSMKRGDSVLFYHSGKQRQIVGVASVVKAAYPDPTTGEGDWVSVDIKPVKSLNQPVSLAAIKSDPALKDLLLVKNSRLSVMPILEGDFQRILRMAATTL